jgi:glycosyltransferase involved in cell wall biosynthesis
VLPFPQSAGQQQRVFYTLKALRGTFHVTFATSVARSRQQKIREQLLEHCDDVILLPSLYFRSPISRAWYQVKGNLSVLLSGLKFSNYLLGKVEFSPSRVSAELASKEFDCVLFEYWHAADSAEQFRKSGIPCVLDMHDILWQAYARQLNDGPGIPSWWKRRNVDRYKLREEAAWGKFDGLIAINQEELNYVKPRVRRASKLFFVPMGTDLNLWSYAWKPTAQPKRVAYYGGLGSRHNQEDALACYKQIMPSIWKEFPDTELWLIGSNPPDTLRALTADKRVKVTGFVEDVQSLLSTMSVVVCPWTGTYGFRSRLIEVLAVGVPLVASNDAVWGMGMKAGETALLGETLSELGDQALMLLRDQSYSAEQSRTGRAWVERALSFEGTYCEFARELRNWLESRELLERREIYAEAVRFAI